MKQFYTPFIYFTLIMRLVFLFPPSKNLGYGPGTCLTWLRLILLLLLLESWRSTAPTERAPSVLYKVRYSWSPGRQKRNKMFLVTRISTHHIWGHFVALFWRSELILRCIRSGLSVLDRACLCASFGTRCRRFGAEAKKLWLVACFWLIAEFWLVACFILYLHSTT